MAKKAGKVQNETKIVVRPIGALGGLDNIHAALIALVVILIALLLVVANSSPGAIVVANGTSNQSCVYGSVNGSCIIPLHNLSQIKQQVGQILASYAYVNGSLSILPYFSSMQNFSAGYLPQSRQWLATVPVTNPANNQNFYSSFLLYDSNLTLVRPYLQTSSTSQIVSDYVVSEGVVRLSGKVACLQQSPLQMYWFIDPYALGSVGSLNNLTALEAKYGSNLNATVKIVYGSQSLAIAQQQNNVNSTQALGKYIYCASRQSNFTSFIANLQSLYSGAYLSPTYLNIIANQSHFNAASFSSCLGSATPTINAQALLAKYYNVTSTPSVVTDCIYQSIPQTARNALCYANSTLC